MKKITLLFFLACSFLVACQAKEVTPKDYDYALLQDKRLIAVQIDNQDRLSSKEEISLADASLSGLVARNLLETSDAYYSSTVFGKESESLVKIDKQTLTLTSKQVNFQTMGLVAKGDQLYRLTGTGELAILDQDFKEIQHSKLDLPATAFYDLIWLGDSLYVLANQAKEEGGSLISLSLLIRLNEKLEQVETIQLTESGAVLNMTAAAGKIYLTMTSQGQQTSGEPTPSSHLLVYDPETGQQDLLQLSMDFPSDIGYNALREELYIKSEAHQENTLLYHLYSLEGDLKAELSYPLSGQGQLEGTFLPQGQAYAYSNGQDLIIDDMEQGRRRTISLEGLNLNLEGDLSLLAGS